MSENNFLRTSVPVKEHETDRMMRECKAEMARTAPTAEEVKELARNHAEALPSLKFAEQAPPLFGEVGNLEGGGPSILRSSSSSQEAGVPPVLVGAHSKHGSAVNSYADLKDDSILYVSGMQVPAGTAAKLGIISRNVDGSYAPPVAPTAEAQLAEKTATDATAADASAAKDASNVVSEPLRGVVNKIAELSGSQEAADNIIAQTVARSIEGDFTKGGEVVRHLPGCEDLGTSSGAVQAAVAEGMRTTAAKLDAAGVPGWETLEWVASNVSAQERSRMALALYHNDPSAWAKLVEIGGRVKRSSTFPGKR